MDNITLSKNQLKAILELVSQIGSNRSQNVSVTSITPAWEVRRTLDGPNDYLIKPDENGKSDENFVTINDDQANFSSALGDNQVDLKSTDTKQLRNETLFWRIENGNQSKTIRQSNSGSIVTPLEYSYPYFSGSTSTRPLIKSQSLGAIECSSILSSPNKDLTLGPLNHQLVSASSVASLIPPQTAPSTSHSLLSFGSYSVPQGEKNFRRYARSVTSSLGKLVGAGDSVDWEEKRRKMLKYRAELAAQKEEKCRREAEEREKARVEEEAAEKRMIAVQRRLKEEYELERKLIEEKREVTEKRRLAVVAAMEQTKFRGRLNRDLHDPHNFNGNLVSVGTQTENPTARDYYNSEFNHLANEYHANRYTFNVHKCSSSAQTDISLLFDLIRSLGFSTMTLKSTSDDEEDYERDTSLLRYKNGPKTVIQRLNKTAKARLGRNGLKFDLGDTSTNDSASGTNQIKRNFSKSASISNLSRIGKSRTEVDQEKSRVRLKTMSSSSSNLFTNEIKPTRLKGITNQKKQSTSNLPLINDNQQNRNLESIAINNRKRAMKSTLEGIL